MLEELTVKNFAVIKKMSVKFGKGLNVITGETGAGKSIMIEALNGLIGERLDRSVIRTGKKQAVIEGVYHINDNIREGLRDFGLSLENPIIIRRIVGSGKKGYINDSPVTLQTLKWLGRQLVELLGQHEQQSLFKIESHLNSIDSFLKIDGKLKQISSLYYKYLQYKKEFEKYRDKMKNLNEKKELIKYQLAEIENADIKEEEETFLLKELNLLKSSEKRKEYISEIVHYFYNGEDSAYEMLSKIEKLLSKLSVVDEAFLKDHKDMEDFLIKAEELGRTIQDYHEKIDHDPAYIDEVVGRLDTIKKLKKKYGDFDKIEELKKNLHQELLEIENYPFDIEDKNQELMKIEEELTDLAKRVSETRKKDSVKFKKSVEKKLKDLKLNAQFEIRFDEVPIGPEGIDTAEFYLTVNPGEEPRPLRKVASGGELSRIALVLKSVLTAFDKTPILIFDEIDTGIGGRVGELVGLRLSELAQHHQVICITHLPQIAKFADYHFLVEKKVKQGRTYTNLEILNDSSRVVELAKMIGGQKVTESAIKKAKEMMEEARCLRSQM